MALGPARYREMAVNLAASLKVMDPSRPVCLVHDAGATVSSIERRFFDDMVEMTADERYPHVMNKIRLFGLSPYGSTMFVDADCLLVKRDVDHYWKAATTRPFSITGERRCTGEWKGVRIEHVLHEVGAPYLIQMNAGVFHFDSSPEAASFFTGLERFYLDNMRKLDIANYRGPRSQSFELYLGLFMGQRNMDCDNVANVGANSWMVSTWRALWCHFEPRSGVSIIYKGNNHLIGVPFLPGRVDRLSPTFAHFIGLKPRGAYQRLARQFREACLCSTRGGNDHQ